MLVAPSAFAQRERGLERPPLRPETIQPRYRAPTQTFGGRAYRGQLAWRNGRWHHTLRNGRFGWWWDVGGFWYFYPERTEGPPDYVSDLEVADDATIAASPPQQPNPPPPQQPKQAFYYHPGDLKGVPYKTIEDCTWAREQAGNVGVCVYK